MPLLFVGIDPSTGDKQSPTVWADLEHEELVLQGWKPGPELEAECAATEVWLFDGEWVHWNHCAGDGSSLGEEITSDPVSAKLCTEAFEAVWARATPHAEYKI